MSEHVFWYADLDIREPGDACNAPGSIRTCIGGPDMPDDTRRRKPITPPSHIMPLDRFPADKRAEIEAAILDPKPPPKFLYFGYPGAPRPLCWFESRAWYEWHWHRGVDPDKKRPPIPTYVRSAVLERDGLICQLCFEPVERSDVHLDHIVPYSKGGKETISNLRVTHSLCNIRRGAGA